MDRIANIVEHRKHFEIDKEHDFDEGELRQKIQFMFPGEYRKSDLNIQVFLYRQY